MRSRIYWWVSVLVGGDERPEVSWEELEDDLSLALSNYFMEDVYPQLLREGFSKEDNHA